MCANAAAKLALELLKIKQHWLGWEIWDYRLNAAHREYELVSFISKFTTICQIRKLPSKIFEKQVNIWFAFYMYIPETSEKDVLEFVCLVIWLMAHHHCSLWWKTLSFQWLEGPPERISGTLFHPGCPWGSHHNQVVVTSPVYSSPLMSSVL